jgi:hypothetical protein
MYSQMEKRDLRFIMETKEAGGESSMGASSAFLPPIFPMKRHPPVTLWAYSRIGARLPETARNSFLCTAQITLDSTGKLSKIGLVALHNPNRHHP